jgi:hypothetical protein
VRNETQADHPSSEVVRRDTQHDTLLETAYDIHHHNKAMGVSCTGNNCIDAAKEAVIDNERTSEWKPMLQDFYSPACCIESSAHHHDREACQSGSGGYGHGDGYNSESGENTVTNKNIFGSVNLFGDKNGYCGDIIYDEHHEEDDDIEGSESCEAEEGSENIVTGESISSSMNPFGGVNPLGGENAYGDNIAYGEGREKQDSIEGDEAGDRSDGCHNGDGDTD